jgi:hypothetical protein
MNKHFAKPIMAICLLGLLVSTATAQDVLKVGDKAPDFEVKTFGDVKVKLSDRFGENGKPTILLFSRASW